jgi:hypothetical protein
MFFPMPKGIVKFRTNNVNNQGIESKKNLLQQFIRKC